jgi:hypothetical protein
MRKRKIIAAKSTISLRMAIRWSGASKSITGVVEARKAMEQMAAAERANKDDVRQKTSSVQWADNETEETSSSTSNVAAVNRENINGAATRLSQLLHHTPAMPIVQVTTIAVIPSDHGIGGIRNASSRKPPPKATFSPGCLRLSRL